MDRMKMFQDIYLLLKGNGQELYVKECLDAIENDTIVFSFKPSLTTESMKREMLTHYQIQQEVTNANVEGYEALLKAIENYHGSLIREVAIVENNCSYIIVCNEVFQDLIGILKSPYTNLNKATKGYYKTLEIGIDVGMVKIHKMKLQEWQL